MTTAATFRFGSPEIAVRVRHHPRARRLVLRVARTAGLPVVTLPPRATLADARAFVLAHEPWLRRHLAARPPVVRPAPGEVLPVGGIPREIQLGPGFRLAGDRLFLPGPPARLPAQAAAFLRALAREAVGEAVARHAARVGRRPGRITLRDPRGRWGSCSAAGDLMFSWRLAMAPPAVLDYVAAHEVAHLAELNHSARFWAWVERLCPGHAAARGWLGSEGGALHRYLFQPEV